MCGSPCFLTVRDELARCQVPERAVGPLLVVVEAPGFDLLPRVLERDELMHVQAPVAQAPVVEPRPGVRKLPDAHAQGGLVLGAALPIPGGATGLVDLYVCGLIPTLPRVGVGCSLNNTGGGSAATPTSTNGP